MDLCGNLRHGAFSEDKFHKALSHFIKVVHTRFEDSGLRSYQQTHQWSVQTLQRGTTPQAKFSYDLAPVEASGQLLGIAYNDHCRLWSRWLLAKENGAGTTTSRKFSPLPAGPSPSCRLLLAA
eukprot:g352.t1